MTLDHRVKQLREFAKRIHLSDDDVQYLLGILAGTVVAERERCARITEGVWGRISEGYDPREAVSQAAREIREGGGE